MVNGPGSPRCAPAANGHHPDGDQASSRSARSAMLAELTRHDQGGVYGDPGVAADRPPRPGRSNCRGGVEHAGLKLGVALEPETDDLLGPRLVDPRPGEAEFLCDGLGVLVRSAAGPAQKPDWDCLIKAAPASKPT